MIASGCAKKRNKKRTGDGSFFCGANSDLTIAEQQREQQSREEKARVATDEIRPKRGRIRFFFPFVEAENDEARETGDRASPRAEIHAEQKRARRRAERFE